MKKIGFIHTPANWDELQTRLDQLSGSEKAVATLYAGMAWNMACDNVAADPARPPAQLNGYDVLAVAPYRAQISGDFAVLVSMPDNSLTPYCVAHWNPNAGQAWHNGDYCTTYANALRRFIYRAGGDDLGAITETS